ncbi:hypothetical protein DYB37_007565 [Aphanomyces astaci]|uniref:Uncharacterized protein n=2 Tax=Aphanomyces astaci TaxID=112090 RepID=A0A3R7B4S0_APHAT|nr:hypothetical protein DYB35_008674 [Aphanomyces astaci]RHZ18378.1 hypothetical protein DYB37_007565 [Aphanomyces astaci]
MTGTNSRSLHGHAYRPQPSAAASGGNRSNSMRGQQAPYTHSDKDEQLYNLVSDLSNACRKDSNANALKDYNLIETLEKSAKDILARRNSQDPVGGNNIDVPPDSIQKRRRLSVEANDDSDETASPSTVNTTPRFQTIKRPVENPPKRYNMPTFFTSMPPRQGSNGTLATPPSSQCSVPEPNASSNPSVKSSATVDFQEFSDNEDNDVPSFMRETISRETYSRETAVYTREALCMDDLSLDEISMIAPGQEDVHRKRQHDAMASHDTTKRPSAAPQPMDIQNIMDQAKGSVDPVYTHSATASSSSLLREAPSSSSATSSLSASSFSSINGKEPDFVYTHLGSKLKSDPRSRSGSKDRSRRGSVDDKRRQNSMTASKLISINMRSNPTFCANSSTTTLQTSSRAQMRSQTMLETSTSTSWPIGKTSKTLSSSSTASSVSKPAAAASSQPAVSTPAKTSKTLSSSFIASSLQQSSKPAAASQPDVSAPAKAIKTRTSTTSSTVPTTTPLPKEVTVVRRDVSKKPDATSVKPPRKEFSLDDPILDQQPRPVEVPATVAVPAPAPPSVEMIQKLEQLELQLAAKNAECARLATELSSQDAQWKVQFAASDTAYKGLEASVAALATDKQALTAQLANLEARIPSGELSTSNRIVWHLREILREEEADNKMESAKASRIAALVNRFEKSNAQVQADFAQQLRHEIKSIGLTRASASLSVDSATTNQTTTVVEQLEERIARHEATIVALTREAQNSQAQLDLALQTAVDRDQDVMQLESRLTSMHLESSPDHASASSVAASQKAAILRLEASVAALEEVVAQRDDEKAELESHVRELTRATQSDATTQDMEHLQTQVKRLQAELEAKAHELDVLHSATPTRESPSVLLNDSFLSVRKSVRFEDDEDSGKWRQQVRKLEAEVAEMRVALYERTCDVNALKHEVLANVETIEHLSSDFAKRVEVGAGNAMEKMDMFLFEQVCAKHKEVEELVAELERKDDEIKELLARPSSTHNFDQQVEQLQTKCVELSAQLKVAMEQNALLTQETQFQARSIESKQNQIKSLLELMQSKEHELAELDEALATAEMQVEYLKHQYNVTFTAEEEDRFAAAYREGGRRSSMSHRRESATYPPNIAPYFTSSAMMDDEGYDEYDRPPIERMSGQSGGSSTILSTAAMSSPTTSLSVADVDFGGSPRFSCLSIGSRDSIASSRTSEWGLEF